MTCLDTALVQQLGLPVITFTLANLPAAGGWTVGTEHEVNLTIVHPSGDLKQHLVVRNLLVVELQLAALGYQALLGRDVLALCDFLYSGRGGTFTLTY